MKLYKFLPTKIFNCEIFIKLFSYFCRIQPYSQQNKSIHHQHLLGLHLLCCVCLLCCHAPLFRSNTLISKVVVFLAIPTDNILARFGFF